MRIPAQIALVTTLLLSTALASCGDSGTKGEEDTLTVLEDGAVVDDTGDIVQPENPWAAPAETGGFEVLFDYRPRIATTPPTANDLWMMDADGKNQVALTEFSGLKDLDPPLSCDLGCFVSPDLKWIAVATGQSPDTGGFDLVLGKFNSELQVAVFKGVTLSDVIDFKFAGDRMFYSTPKDCTGPSCIYQFQVVELGENVNVKTPFLEFPPANVLADSTYKGHFKVSADGKNLVMLQTTIRSVAVYLWRDGTGLVQLDFICKYGTQGDCTGTGSEYSDLDPVAISPDSRWIVFFTFSDRWQRARVYDTQNPDSISLATFASVPAGVYIEKACDAGVLADWQWQRVRANPTFTPDGKELLFLAENACPVDGQQPEKPATNLLRVKFATLQSGKTLVESDVFNVTENPTGNVTANKRVTAFDLSPDGATIIFTATPTLTQGGATIGDGDARQRNDREVYRVRLDGENLQQLTNNITALAESPQIVVR